MYVNIEDSKKIRVVTLDPYVRVKGQGSKEAHKGHTFTSCTGYSAKQENCLLKALFYNFAFQNALFKTFLTTVL